MRGGRRLRHAVIKHDEDIASGGGGVGAQWADARALADDFRLIGTSDPAVGPGRLRRLGGTQATVCDDDGDLHHFGIENIFFRAEGAVGIADHGLHAALPSDVARHIDVAVGPMVQGDVGGGPRLILSGVLGPGDFRQEGGDLRTLNGQVQAQGAVGIAGDDALILQDGNLFLPSHGESLARRQK